MRKFLGSLGKAVLLVVAVMTGVLSLAREALLLFFPTNLRQPCFSGLVSVLPLLFPSQPVGTGNIEAGKRQKKHTRRCNNASKAFPLN